MEKDNMREIKFRAWDKSTNKMASFEKMQTNARFAIDAGLDSRQFIVLPKHQNVVLMQFTGLKDKNGKEIYGGDIVKHYDYPRQKFSIEYNAPSFEARHTRDGTLHPVWHNGKLTDYEIIGNIYENPELIKEN